MHAPRHYVYMSMALLLLFALRRAAQRASCECERFVAKERDLC
jgi:hypothetical protein